MYIVIFAIIIVVILSCNYSDNKENFYFRAPPLSYSNEACLRMCDNTDGCNSAWFDPSTRQCWMNQYYKYGDLYYPYVNNTYFWSPSRFRYGKYFGKMRNHRPNIKRFRRRDN